MVMVSELRACSFTSVFYFLYHPDNSCPFTQHYKYYSHQPLCQKRKESTEQFIAKAVCHDGLIL